jgi:hypothetical protein
MKKLECVIVCINYTDFLAHTLPFNKKHFNKMVVVTDTKDIETKKLCEKWNVTCISSDDMYVNDATVPNKGIAINIGLKHIDCNDWVVIMDADIWLPDETRTILNKNNLDESKLYGIDRLMCNSYEEWINFIYSTKSIYEGWIYQHCDFFKIGTRLIQYHGDLYWPIGFFQLWNANKTNIKTYPIANALPGYDRVDVQMLKLFPTEKRELLASLICIHLASEDHKQGQNWKGRGTKQFGPTIKIKPKNNYKWKIFNFFRYFLIKLIY